MKFSAGESVQLCIFLIICYISVDRILAGSISENYDKFRQNRFCNRSSFRCDSGECIQEEHLCDGIIHCKDGSDETKTCINIIPCASKIVFQCDYGACINKDKQCDGKRDCRDNSDETEIACGKCGNSEFRCSSGECINDENICDGVANCRDYSDETTGLCSTINCPAYTYRCKYGACVKRSARCDGIINCVDASDENGCYADETYVANIFKSRCMRYEFKCDNGECISEKNVCNGKKDCSDGSDETFDLCAYKRCPSEMFKCDYGGCIPERKYCNDVPDCWDNSDESNCSPIIEEITKRPAPSITSTSTTELGSCFLPKHPKNGKYETPKLNGVYNPNDNAPPFTVLLTKCNDGYVPSPASESPISVCFGASWIPSPFKCKRTCPALISTGYTECTFENKPLKTCANAVDGTIALTRCVNANEDTDTPNSMIQVCHNGKWDKIPINQDFSSTNSNGTTINVFYIAKNKKR